MSSSERFQPIIRPALPALVALTLSYMVMTEAQEESWAADSAQYVADMDEDFNSCRASGEMLLQDLCEVGGPGQCNGAQLAVCPACW